MTRHDRITGPGSRRRDGHIVRVTPDHTGTGKPWLTVSLGGYGDPVAIPNLTCPASPTAAAAGGRLAGHGHSNDDRHGVTDRAAGRLRSRCHGDPPAPGPPTPSESSESH